MDKAQEALDGSASLAKLEALAEPAKLTATPRSTEGRARHAI